MKLLSLQSRFPMFLTFFCLSFNIKRLICENCNFELLGSLPTLVQFVA